MKAGADSKHFGEYLQHHLDRFPPPTREEYLALTAGHTAYYQTVKRKKVAVLTYRPDEVVKESRRILKERARRARMTPEEREWDDQLREAALNARTYDRAGEVVQSQ